MSRPRILIQSDGTCANTRIVTEDGYDLSQFVTAVEWELDCNGQLATAKLHVAVVAGEMSGELADLIVQTHDANREERAGGA